MLILYLLLAVSVVADTLKNSFMNSFGKDTMKGNYDALVFNCIGFVGGAVFFLISGWNIKTSWFSLVLALIFAAVTLLAQYFTVMGMSLGSMTYTVLFSYCGMLIPTVFGIIRYSQPVGALKIIGLVLMLVTFYLSTDPKSESKITGKWLFFGIGNFVLWGAVGVIQLIHQNSVYAGEINDFLGYSFVFMLVICILACVVVKQKEKARLGFGIKSRATALAVVCGLFVAIINKINLYLSGQMPSIIFFPIVNGGVIILSSAIAVAVFGEKLSLKQKLGIIVGIVSVCLLGIEL